MKRRPGSSSAQAEPGGIQNPSNVPNSRSGEGVRSPKRSGYAVLALFILVINGSWAVYHYQHQIMPEPLSASEAGKRGFSEDEAVKHVKALAGLGPHTVGSDALDVAVQYVLSAAENIKKTAHWEVDVQVDFFHSKTGAHRLAGGLSRGKTVAYSDLSHVVLRILPKYASEAEDSAILVSSHIDTVFSAEGAGDCSSCIAVMLELARAFSQWSHGSKNSVIFLFNTGEEEGLNGAHSFITQHPWSTSVRLAVDLEAMGIGGKSGIFQTGRNPWAVKTFAMVAKYPSAQIISQDLFSSGAINSGTDFQIYMEVAGLSGLDFAYTDKSAVYHTKNDKVELLTAGSFQHLGENMLAFLLQAGASSHIPRGEAIRADQESSHDPAVYFDILGSYMVVYGQSFANMLYNSVILQSLVILSASLLLGGYSAAVLLALSCLSIVLMWICSLGLSIIVALILPQVCSSPVPFVASPLLAVGLFAAPALLGALTGQHLGYLILQKYLSSIRRGNLSPSEQADLAKLDAERWLFKAGLVQWLVLLSLGNYYKIGCSYLAFAWLVSPAFAYGLLEASLYSVRLPRPIKTLTLLMGLSLPFLISAGTFISLAGTIIGNLVRFDKNPGSTSEWMGSVIVAAYIGIVVCLTLVYLLSCVHFSGAKIPIFIATITLFGLSLAALLYGIVPPFTEDTSRAVNVVHVVDTTGTYGGKQEPVSYISLFSPTPGKLTTEIQTIGEGFVCGREKALDFVTFSVKYGCWSQDDVYSGWSESDIPLLHVESDIKVNGRTTKIVIDAKTSTRWALAINTVAIEDFEFKVSSDPEDLGPLGEIISVDGKHIIRFSGGKKSPTRFDLTLHWAKNYTRVLHEDRKNADGDILLKLRTDVNRLTPKAQRVLEKLPPWCSQFGKSTFPHNLAFLTSLPVNF